MNERLPSSRRKFLRNSTLAAAGTFSLPQLVSAALKTEPLAKKIALHKDDVILFQGDSITDSGRKKDDANPNTAAAFGNGYALMAASALLVKQADKSLKIYNRGISGNKVFQLSDRWQKDCLDLRPNVLSLLIGVNDFWHTLSNNYKGTVQTYRDDLSALLTRTRQALPDVKLVIGEPFALTGIKAVDDTWYPAFNDYRSASREIASSFGAAFIPYQNIFDKAQSQAPGVYWTYDGVHPSAAGAQLMAQAWLQTVK